MEMAAWAPSALRRIVLFPFRVMLRVVVVCITATLVGLGGGLGNIGRGPRETVKSEMDNPIVCVAEESVEQE